MTTTDALDEATKLRSPRPASPVEAVSDIRLSESGITNTTLLRRYRLDELLGQGGMGVVFRATDLQMPGVQIALKLLKPELRQMPELLNMLRESVRKVRALPHPNIAGVYSLESDAHGDFIIMELLQGQTLQALLDAEYARGLPIGMARSLIADLCSALAYAHDHGVIHSDIKPSNIFVTPSGRAKLFDFDIARLLRGPSGYFDAGKLGALTLAYCSLEMEEGARPDPRDDVYALACVIYEMLTGAHPFDGVSASDAQKKGLQPKPLPALRRRENHALLQALKFKRDERLPSVEALGSAFGSGNSGAPRVTAAVAAVAATEPSLRFSLPKLALPLVIGAAGIVLCGALATWWLLRSPSGAQHKGPAAPAAIEQAKSVAAQAAAASAANSPRVAQLGTSASQMQQALQLCQQLQLRSQRCSAADLVDESPRSVSLTPFAIDPAPVTNTDFASFVGATGRRTTAETKGSLYAVDPVHGWTTVLRGQNWRTLRDAASARGQAADSLPVLGIDLESARAYCTWKGKRLPTEDEWEYDARGPSSHIFRWGDQPDASPPLTEANNVAQWAETRIPGQRVLRGGSWLLPQPYFQRLALRRLAPPGGVSDASFRCATSLESWPK